jgi:hypothetical protein
MNGFRDLIPVPGHHSPSVTALLKDGIALVEDLSFKLQCLDDLLLTGRPEDISTAAAAVEMALQSASPVFADISATMGRIGARTLNDAAQQFRADEQSDAAGLADSLRAALARFARRSVNANRRAQQLNRGINAALRSLQALGVQDHGRLIAEA